MNLSSLNDLSQALYWIELLDTMEAVSTGVIIFSAFLFFIMLIVIGECNHLIGYIGTIAAPILFVIFATVLVVLPNGTTTKMIALSEVGEQIINTEEAKEIGNEAKGLMLDSLKTLRKSLDVKE